MTDRDDPADKSLAQTISDTCTCEYPYPREIWDGHHPDCATLNREENSQP